MGVNARACVRSTYVSKGYAIGAGARSADIDDPTVRHSHTFGIIWKDTAPRNWLFFVHPYWYVNRLDDVTGEPLGIDDWSGTSPFLQMVHWENAAVLLLELPGQDPYRGQAMGSNEKWISDRPEKLFQRLNAYVPETIDEAKQTDAGVFLRSGSVFVGMRPIGGELAWESCGRKGYRRLRIEGELIGVSVEVGDQAEYESFSRFVEQVSNAQLDLGDLSTEKRVRYHSTRGHCLDIQHNSDDWRPIASINGIALDFDSWPTCESAYLTCRDGIMDVNDGRTGRRIDWQNDDPVYASYTLP